VRKQGGLYRAANAEKELKGTKLMKTGTNISSRRAAALQITLRITLILFSVALLALGAAPARRQIEQKPMPAGIAVESAHRDSAVSESSASLEGRTARKSTRIEISANHQRVSGREIAGFRARQRQAAQEEKLTPPAGLKPVEEEAWLAMARRQGASGMGLESFYPASYGGTASRGHRRGGTDRQWACDLSPGVSRDR
jgi:hypothetical protein